MILSVTIRSPRYEPDQDEFIQLAESAGATIVCNLSASLSEPHSRTFVGKGKTAEVAELVKKHRVGIIFVDGTLSPGQEKNLESHLCARVVDRTRLILDIFATRAKTFEGRLQVELAQLNYIKTRLVRGWTHLERQKGGIGLRGPGESQLETDRRLISRRIDSLKIRLDKVKNSRFSGRKARRRNQIVTIAIVGYTNAGKSTLFNALTNENNIAEDQLFATLDPTIRKINLPGGIEAVLADTVGFIQALPHSLIDAFRATLEETINADLLIHVQDGSHPERRSQEASVLKVLQEIGASKIPQIVAVNKSDRILDTNIGNQNLTWVSAFYKTGLEQLKLKIVEGLDGASFERKVRLTPEQGSKRAFLYSTGSVIKEVVLEDGSILMTIFVSQSRWYEICKNCGFER